MVTFVPMKRKYALISLLFAWAVLTAMLIQSVHSFHHLEEEFSKEKCHHEHTNNKAELTHSHENDHCFVCEFAFSTTVSYDAFVYQFNKTELPSAYTFTYSKEITNHFKGSLFALRAPPFFIV